MHRVCSVLSMLFALAGIAACGVRGRPLSVPLAAGRTPCRGTRTGTQLAEVYAGEKLTLAFAIHNPT
jgi:predicted small lipoprotein YifL